ncbi:MAG: hypothetical protein IMW99_00250 [Firmicutes bacterium]|nr:hypothetical protein [Bacillota bacterium]
MAGLVVLHIGGVLAGMGGGWLRWDGVAQAGMVLWAVTAGAIGWIVLFSRRRP